MNAKNYSSGMVVTLMVATCIVITNANANTKSVTIVATQRFFAELASEIGKDKIAVSYVAFPKFNIHQIQPKPSDIRNVSRADLYPTAGLDAEPWSEALLQAAGNPRLFVNGTGYVDLSHGIHLLGVPAAPITRADGDIHIYGNTHYHMDPRNAVIMAQTMLAKLQEIDPEHAEFYNDNAAVFIRKLEDNIRQWLTECTHYHGREIIAYHDDIVYFAYFLGLKVARYIEPKPGIPPSPRYLAELAEYARQNQIKTIVMPTYFPRSQGDKLADLIGGKTVIICQNVGELPGTDSIFTFYDHNMTAIEQALR
jgi:ABC-type Zn uptake system ZnuABC Zn-binding protein ZnuA